MTGSGRFLPTAAVATAAATLITGCGLLELGGDTAEEPGNEVAAEESADAGEDAVAPTGEPVTRRETIGWNMYGSEAEVSLHRVDDDHMVAQMTITHEGSNTFAFGSSLAEGFGESNDYSWDYFSGIAWLDPDGRTLHRPFYVDDEGTCLCSESRGAYMGSDGDTWEGYAVLAAPPENVEALTVVTQVAAPFINVPVEAGAPDGLDYESPADVPEAEAEVAELESVIESEEDSVIQDAETTDINLSTDVLFDLEESDLTDEADEALDDAAADLEALNPTEVTIEGHADDSGTDDINDPLSEERAESVRAALEERIDADITFETEGFGSSEPIASNSDEDGRARNRRVTISVPRGTEVAGQATEDNDSDTGENADNGEDAPAQGTGIPVEEASLTGPASGNADDGDEVDIQLTTLEAITPTTALLTYEIHNPNSGRVSVNLDTESDRWMEFRYHATHAVTLNDPDRNRTAHPLRVHPPDDRDKPYCFCTSTAGINMGSTRIPEDTTREYYAMLPITPGTTVTDITLGAIGTIEDVAIA